MYNYKYRFRIIFYVFRHYNLELSFYSRNSFMEHRLIERERFQFLKVSSARDIFSCDINMCDKMFDQIRAKKKKKKIVTKLENEWSRTLKLIDWSFETIFRRASRRILWTCDISNIVCHLIINTYPPKIYILLSYKLTYTCTLYFHYICVQVPRVSTAFSITWIWSNI